MRETSQVPSNPKPEGALEWRNYASAGVILFLALLGSHLATPLYPIWQRTLGMETSDVTLVFACYPIGVTLGLLYGGRLGDQLGRRVPLFIGVALTLCVGLSYMGPQSMLMIALARLGNGIAIGLLSGPAVAAIIELHPLKDRSAASRFGAIVTLCSPAVGLLGASLLVHGLAEAQAVVYPFFLQIGGAILALGLLLTLRETIRPENRRTLATMSWRPQKLSVPMTIRTPFVFGAATAVLGWSVTGLWLSLGPSMAQLVLGEVAPLVGGLTVVAFLAIAALVQIATRHVFFMRAILYALLLSIPSFLLMILTLQTQSLLGLALCALVSGSAQGMGWAGASELINRIAPANIRASVVSVLYICSYFGSVVPIIVTGFLADRIGLLAALMVLMTFYLCVIAVLLWGWRRFAATADWAQLGAKVAD